MRSFLLLLAGVATAVLTAIGLLLLEETANFSLYSMTIMFVIPVGAILSGMVAGTGLFGAARLMNMRPHFGVLLNMLVAGAIVYFLINYVPYQRMVAESPEFAEQFTFPTYLDLRIRSTQVMVGRGGNGQAVELSPFWAYTREIIEGCGFLLGGLFLFGILGSAPYCESCSKYATGSTKHEWKTKDAEAFAERANLTRATLAQGDLDAAASVLTNGESDRKGSLAMALAISSCPACGRRHGTLTAHKGTDEISALAFKTWEAIEEADAAEEFTSEVNSQGAMFT